ncbi:glycosyltransferase family 2 protein [Flavobacterium psychrotolerans]|uniref:Glycosyltransferase family 2 protein n=1 Tax=Flavobacterium psychrotolerans TaxID=2169410 RepID=A0A2U1JFL7_9FLAO|nr:glycosyltransferase family A protein [Flavobacterium psychrotolerans]PWA03887.1 glycosyltransferase family 2 protein [Flavobacterium psychrotolerans]
MIIIYHNNNKVVATESANLDVLAKANNSSIVSSLFEIAKANPDDLLVWCHMSLKNQLNSTEIEKIFHHRRILVSYNPSDIPFLDESIGYVEDSPFIKINKSVSFPTWQMSGMVGGVHSEVLLALKNGIKLEKDFDYFLCSLAKLGMPKGLLCYSEPKLLKNNAHGLTKKASIYVLFQFVKQHYKTRWTFLLFLNLIFYERKIKLLPMVFALFYRSRTVNNYIKFDSINVQSSINRNDKITLDVVIPTIGRKKYLYDILVDLKVQTYVPTNVIIIEQNPTVGSKSELDFLTNEIWPFAIKHRFTNQTGACNARNVALENITSDWVFFADDDIRIEPDLIQKTLDKINRYGTKAVTLKCYQNNDDASARDSNREVVFQWGSFGAGCSFVFSEILKNCKFGMGYEFGFGEDLDFGMQLRNQGCDILYFPEPKIIHLKAPVGGFRTKPTLRWQKETDQPKPSPTVMLYLLFNNSKQQQLGYKTTLFIKYYKLQKIKNPIRYFINFRKQWDRSIFWANELKKT